ncbi:hypothetical protein BGP77_06135 [Saccharospirillum sp. MSK14-1]|nr:hypothetical protein BGP77_06135 [Saccharospirillum sp. MSK14-1]
MVSINNRFEGLAAKLDFDQLSQVRPPSVDESDQTPQRTLGASFSIHLTLDSGTQVEFGVRQGLSGRMSDLTLYASQTLTDKEKDAFELLVQGLASGIDELFGGRANGKTDLFQSLANAPVDDLEVSASKQTGTLSQQLSLDQEERRSGETHLQSDWQQSDMESGISDRHGFELLKKPGSVAQAYGQVDTGWLEQKLSAATSVLGATLNLAGGLQSDALSSFYGSGLNALLQAANEGSRALQDIGASAEQARHLVTHTLDALTQVAMKPDANDRGGIQAGSDFDGTFTSHRTQGFRETGPGTYNFDLEMAQRSHESYDAERDETNTSQRRELTLNYETANEQQSLSLRWDSEERQRYTKVDGQIEQGENRRREILQWVIKDTEGRASGYERLRERYNVDYSKVGEATPFADIGNDGRHISTQQRINYQV